MTLPVDTVYLTECAPEMYERYRQFNKQMNIKYTLDMFYNRLVKYYKTLLLL